VRVDGNRGYIELETTPDLGIRWGAFMYNHWENWGLWNVVEHVSGRPLGGAMIDKIGPVHGSRQKSELPTGGMYGVVVEHYFPMFAVYWVWTYNPTLELWHWVPVPYFQIAKAGGILNCILS
jgi:hypothetical protein